MLTYLKEEDIKEIRYRKREGFVLCSIILAFTMFFDICYLSISENKNWFLFVVINLFVLILDALILNFINRDYNKDLEEKVKLVKKEKVARKGIDISYPPGSAYKYKPTPLFGWLLPELFKQEMRGVLKFYLIINDHKYYISEDLYEHVDENDFVNMSYSKHSNILLEISKF